MKTFRLRKEDISRKWYLIDAKDQVVGRLAGQIAKILCGKHRTEYSHDVDSGDYVVVTNCEKVKISGKKAMEKEYHSHSWHIGGLKTVTYQHMLEKHPERILEIAVKGMLPKNKLQAKAMARLRVYSGESHPHAAQKFEKLTA